MLFEECFLIIVGEFFFEVLGELDRWFVLVVTVGDFELTLFNCTCSKEGGDSLGDLIFIAASSRVNGNAGDGDLLDTGEWIAARCIGDFDLDFSFAGTIVFCTAFGGSFGNAMSNILSSFFSTLIFTGLITFLPNVSLALAASPLCKRFRVFNSLIRSSSSCFGSSSAISASSSLEDRKLTRGVISCIFLLLEIDRDFCLLS